MTSYSLKRRKIKESKNPKVVKTKNGRKILSSKCAVCNSKKWKFIKEQQTKGFISNFKGIKIKKNTKNYSLKIKKE